MQDSKMQLNELRKKLTNSVWCLSLSLNLIEFLFEDRLSEKISTFRYFFYIVEESLQKEIVVTLRELFLPEPKAKKGLNRFLQLVRSNLESLTEQNLSKGNLNKLRTKIDNQLQEIKKKEIIVSKIKGSEYGYYALFKSSSFRKFEELPENFSLNFKELFELEKLCKDIVNWHEKNVFKCETTLWEEKGGRRDLENLLYVYHRNKVPFESIKKRTKSLELSDKINRRDIEIINENAELINKQVKETLEFQAEW